MDLIAGNVGLRPHVDAKNQERARPFVSSDGIVCLALLGDIFAILGAMVLALFQRTNFNFSFETRGFDPGEYKNAIFLGAALYILLLQFNRAYRKHRFVHRFYMLGVVLKSASMWVVGYLTLTLVLEFQTSISRVFVFWSLVDSVVLLIAWRMLFRHALRGLNWASLLRDRVLVVGWSKESDALARQIGRDAAHPFEVIGCTPSAHGRFWVRPPQEVPVLGDYNGLRSILSEFRPDILILADLDPVVGELVALARLCTQEHVQFKVIPSFFPVFASGLQLESVSGIPVVGVSNLPLDQLFNRVLKRLVDVAGALVGLFFAAPLMAIFGWMVYRESPGSIFYTQLRSGQAGRPFRIFKLRSMRLNAEADGPQWTTENDPRRLKVGELMRRTNIDEVPQFWNVLKGEMSLVGPRPERPELIVNFKEQIVNYNARHQAKPGLTGYAQVNGLRGNTDLEARVRYDLYYLENWSLWLDIQIMLKTFFVRKNAY